MYMGLVKRTSQTLKEFRLWEGKVFNTKMEKKIYPSSCCFFNQVIIEGITRKGDYVD